MGDPGQREIDPMLVHELFKRFHQGQNSVVRESSQEI
jgi:hypothetical protein